MHDITRSEFRTIRFERDGDVLVATIDRPGNDLNAVNEDLHEDLTRLFRELKQETVARAVLLTGSGKAFSAGGDFAWFPELQQPGRMDALRRDAKQLIWDLLDVEIPIVAAVNGHAMGLVNRAVPAGELHATAMAFAKRLAEGAPLAVQFTKLAVNKLIKDALNVSFDAATALEIVTFQSEDHREALAALREKRKPRFTGR